MNPDRKFTLQEVKEIVGQMAGTLAMLHYFLSSEVVGEFGPAGEEVIRRAIHKYGHARGSKIKKKVLDKGLPLTVENLSKFYDLPLPLVWESEKVRSDENYLEKKVTYCPFAEEWKRLKGEKLGLLYCEQDLCMRQGYNPEFDLKQFTNVLNKDPHCHTIVQWKKGSKKD